jgi:hypothetical protein
MSARRAPLFVALVVASIIAVASATAAAMRSATFPAQIVGTWTRTVTKADVTREEAYGPLAGSACTLTVQRSGAAHVACPKIQSAFTGSFVPKGTNRIQIEFADQNPNSYSWRVSGKRLFLKKLKDANADRAATMSGTWKAK